MNTEFVRVTVYTKPDCRPCAATKRWLEKHNIPFREEPAADHLPFLEAIGATSAPVVEVQHFERSWREYWHGHQPRHLDNLATTYAAIKRTA